MINMKTEVNVKNLDLILEDFFPLIYTTMNIKGFKSEVNQVIFC
jgi:hypothetical protein